MLFRSPVTGSVPIVAIIRPITPAIRPLSSESPASEAMTLSPSMPRDRKRLVRALEVYYTTGRPLTAHFTDTMSPIADCEVVAVALRLPPALTAERVARRVDEQFARGIVDEVRTLLARGVPPDARPFGGLVYRQVMEMLRGVRGEAETRALIVQENRRYARRQLIWFRKEPNLVWLDGPGESPATFAAACRAIDAFNLKSEIV